MIHELTIDLEKKIGTLRGSLNREFFLPVFLYFSTGDVVEIVPNGIMHHHIDTDTLTFKVSPRRTDTSTFKTSVQITITGTITKVFSFTTWPPPRHLLISTISEIGLSDNDLLTILFSTASFDKECCGNCRFACVERDHCLRNAPVVQPNGVTTQPKTSVGEWCGKYKQKKSLFLQEKVV
jgi:hypothetical protein